jgi:hypothetical protein
MVLQATLVDRKPDDGVTVGEGEAAPVAEAEGNRLEAPRCGSIRDY